jgi:DNA polymerase-1
MRPRLFLIDTYGFIFRAYHARARSGAPPMRTSTGLPTEAVFIFNNMLRKLTGVHHPEYIAAIFEKGPSFREEQFAEYKANRAAMPEDLVPQIGYVERLLGAMRITVLQYPGFEADDVIGTLARSSEGAGVEVVVVSSDKDLLQLVDDRVFMLNPMKDDLWYDAAKVEEFMGVPPARVADLLALKGDSVDNIPGAPGIGDKGARDLIVRFGSVEAALDRAAEVERKTYRESLENNREQILLSKKLATLDTAVPVKLNLEEVKAREPDVAALKDLYKELEFFSLLRELGPSEETRPRDYKSLESAEAVERYLAAIPAGKPVAVALGQDLEGGLPLSTVGIAWQAGEARSIPWSLLGALRELLEDANRPKIAYDAKTLMLALAREGIEARGFAHDVMLYAFLLSADPGACRFEDLVQRELDLKLGNAAEQHADCARELAEKLSREIAGRGLGELYSEIELPLIPVLARMERTGIRVDPLAMQRLSDDMNIQLQRLTSEIHELAGKGFNINSPQQLGRVLFEDLGLPSPVKRGKGKAISTAADVLEELAPDYEIVRKVLEYRQLAKLKNTYVDALPALIDPHTFRLHTSFNQAGAATGRLSSSNPNLQNIPIRSELGREIRAAFIPRDGWKLVVADYSQIELRLLAHMSRDAVLTESFLHGEDIHTRTASEVFGVPPLMVTPEMRRNAKAVNFGIVYGQTPFGLAAQLGISRKDAEIYIKRYFERYAGVRKFLDATIQEVRRTGVARTLSGRQRPIPDMDSPNPNARSFAERTAVNTPLQGTAADLIKVAMIRIDHELEARGLKTAMLLQVHDELLFESPPEELGEVMKLVKKQMEGVYKLDVPLLVEIGTGDNWRDAK